MNLSLTLCLISLKNSELNYFCVLVLKLMLKIRKVGELHVFPLVSGNYFEPDQTTL